MNKMVVPARHPIHDGSMVANSSGKTAAFGRPRPHHVHMLLWYLAIPALAIVGFAPAVSGFFQYDDFILLQLARTHWSLSHPQSFILASQNGLFTPLNNLLFYAEYKTFGLWHTGYVLISLLLHLTNTILLVLLVRSITKDHRPAILTGVLFIIGFSYQEATSWVAAYVHLVTALFYLLSILLYLLHGQLGLRRYYLLSIGSFALGLLSKEPIVTLPALIVVTELYLGKRQWRKTVPFMFIGFCYALVMYAWQKFSSSTVFMHNGTYDLSIRGLARFRDLGQLVIPPPSEPTDHFLSRHLGTQAVESHQILFLIVSVATVAFLAYIILRGRLIVQYFALWMIITFSPFVFVTTGIASRYMYLPGAGFCMLCAFSLHNLLKTFDSKGCKRTKLLFAVIVGAYVLSNITFLYVWQYQMDQNGRVRQSVLVQLARQLEGHGNTTAICLQGLDEKYNDISLALPLWLQNPPRVDLQRLAPGCGLQDSLTFRWDMTSRLLTSAGRGGR